MTKNTMKRICILVTLIVIGITYAQIKRQNRTIGEAVQVTSLPVSGKTVILDAGHGTPDERCGK